MLYRWQPQPHPHLCLLDLVNEVPQNHSDYVWSKSGVGLGVVLTHIIRVTKHVS
jgi:hypothetical protein